MPRFAWLGIAPGQNAPSVAVGGPRGRALDATLIYYITESIYNPTFYICILVSGLLPGEGIRMNVMTKTRKGYVSTLTVDDLTRAIRNSIDREGMKDEEARAMAQHVLNFFGYSERIIDNILEPEDRDAFYMLEDSGLLTTEREETTLYDGREWRIHYWLFRKDKILELVKAARMKEHAFLENPGACYADVPDDIWSTRGKPGEEGEEEK